MKVLGLAFYPIENTSTRYRLAQFIEPLAKQSITTAMHLPLVLVILRMRIHNVL
jgi:hypothetical protein